jgi:hypothetical protein
VASLTRTPARSPRIPQRQDHGSLDLLAGQPVVRSPAAAASQLFLDLFDTAPNVCPETPNVLFSDTRLEDIETDGQLVCRLWT